MPKNLASTLALVTGVLVAGAAIGFYVRPLLRPELQTDATTTNMSPSSAFKRATMITACNFDSDQLGQLASNIAPLVARQLNQLGAKGGIDVADAKQQQDNRGQGQAAQLAAYSRATQMVDQMIANRRVSHQGMADAVKLLQQSGQTDRAYELQGRIAVAMNRGELTPEEAGMTLPPSVQNRMR